MRQEKYIYNPHTLQFEKLKKTKKSLAITLFGYFSAVLVSAFIFYYFTSEFFPSPREKALEREMQQMEYQYMLVNDQAGNMRKVLDNIQNRDAKVHRILFGMDPIDKEVWESGVGGSEKYPELQNIKIAGNTLRQTKKYLDQLESQIYLQSKSLDTIEKLTKLKEEDILSTPSIKPVRIDKLNRDMSLMSGYGIRLHPIHKIHKMHQGIDFAAPIGTPIQSTGNGVVKKVEYKDSGYGRSVLIDHGNGYQTLYAHMKEVTVRDGQKVKKGQQIGSIGNTGSSTSPHCHYEVRRHGKPVNPIHYCMDGLSPIEYQEMVEKAEITNQSFD